jgi:molybdopterin molybdotransferase
LSGLLSVTEAQSKILSNFKPVPSEPVVISACAGRILAEDVLTPLDLPPFANSSMDGFAVRVQDVRGASRESPVMLPVTGDIPAGATAPFTLLPGQAARIMTGAPVPEGADAIVPVEDTDCYPSPPGAPLPETVQIYKGAAPGANVRPRGQDVQEGMLLLRKGRRLEAQDVGLLASVGKKTVNVYRRPKVALFSSGDELVAPGETLQPGQIYDANQYMLAAQVEREGAEVIRLGTAPDHPDAVLALLRQAAAQGADLILTSAGVSVGAFDFVRQVIETHGELGFWRINMRPGKPLAFGHFMEIPLIGLPGNPVSAFTGCRVFVLPAVRLLAGIAQTLPRRERAVLAEPVESDGRESYLRAVVEIEDGSLTARLAGHQGSANLYALVQANALLIVPSGVKSLPLGSEVEIWFLEGNDSGQTGLNPMAGGK